MPLKKGQSKKAISQNISELMHGKMGTARKKAVKTMEKKGLSPNKARQKQAVAIALSVSRKK